MHHYTENDITAKPGFLDKVQRKFLHLFRLTNQPVVKVYHGYGHTAQLVIFGHVFGLSPLPRKKYRRNFWTNTFALVRSFMVKRIPNARVILIWNNEVLETQTASDGFFRFEWPSNVELQAGLYEIEIAYAPLADNNKFIAASGRGTIKVPHKSQYAFISDIDDTFLVSHSSTFWRKLYVLFTKNAHSRKPFEGVVRHYQLLAEACAPGDIQNPFFYVSSSEWNLYDFIKEFIRKNKLPEGVFLLSQVKKLSELFKTGANKHATKFMRIARILEAYPQQQFILLGDDSQMDPVIYASVIEHFPGRIICVYLRHVYEKNITNVNAIIKKIQEQKIAVCHFTHSKDAIEHSVRIGLITSDQLNDPAFVV